MQITIDDIYQELIKNDNFLENLIDVTLVINSHVIKIKKISVKIYDDNTLYLETKNIDLPLYIQKEIIEQYIEFKKEKLSKICYEIAENIDKLIGYYNFDDFKETIDKTYTHKLSLGDIWANWKSMADNIS